MREHRKITWQGGMNKKIYCGYVSNLPQQETVDTSYEVTAKHQLNGLYWGVPTVFLLDLRDMQEKKKKQQTELDNWIGYRE